jgi:hypothetical protein
MSDIKRGVKKGSHNFDKIKKLKEYLKKVNDNDKPNNKKP